MVRSGMVLPLCFFSCLPQALAELEKLSIHCRTPAEETGMHLAVDCGDDLAALRIVKVLFASYCQKEDHSLET